jgi:hypothetical protein
LIFLPQPPDPSKLDCEFKGGLGYILRPYQKKKDGREGGRSEKARCQWLTPIILATQEEEIRRITGQASPGK